MRTDNGTEYETNEFKNFCREAGIKRETTTVYTPKQNGIAERKNMTIMEATYAMLCNQGLPKFLWGEAANTAVYIQNRCLHSALESKTPEEVSLVRNLTSHILEFLDVLFIFMCRKRRGGS